VFQTGGMFSFITTLIWFLPELLEMTYAIN